MSVFHHILVAYDGSRDGDAALELAGELARDQNASLTLLTVVPDVSTAVTSVAAGPYDLEGVYNEILTTAREKIPADVSVTTRLEHGPPAAVNGVLDRGQVNRRETGRPARRRRGSGRRRFGGDARRRRRRLDGRRRIVHARRHAAPTGDARRPGQRQRGGERPSGRPSRHGFLLIVQPNAFDSAFATGVPATSCESAGPRSATPPW